MEKLTLRLSILLVIMSSFISSAKTELTPIGAGSYDVGVSSFEIADKYQNVGDDAMHQALTGQYSEQFDALFVDDMLAHPASAWVVEVPVPNIPDMYGPVSGHTLTVSAFITFPSKKKERKNSYTFPYFNGDFGVFDDMLAPGQSPEFADDNEKYPLILLSHGYSAHGIYDVGHAQDLSRHGYIVAVLFYGDLRTDPGNGDNGHNNFLRPLFTKAMLDSILDSDEFGDHIDTNAIGISGHSFGGFTSLALAGGNVDGNEQSVVDPRIKAAVLAAPWVGHRVNLFRNVYAFGDDNQTLANVEIPVISFVATKDDVTTPESIYPAMKQLNGDTYVIDLVDQPHVFEGGSWEDRNNWELLFFNAYLKDSSDSVAKLRQGASMAGGNIDRQLFDYQKIAEDSE